MSHFPLIKKGKGVSPYLAVSLNFLFNVKPVVMNTIKPMIAKITPMVLCSAIAPPIINRHATDKIERIRKIKFFHGIVHPSYIFARQESMCPKVPHLCSIRRFCFPGDQCTRPGTMVHLLFYLKILFFQHTAIMQKSKPIPFVL